MDVIFRKDRESGDIVAVFPSEPHDSAGRYWTCYMHVGQHSSCSLEWYRTTRPATEAESADLLRELTGIYTTRPAGNPEIYGESVTLRPVKRMTAAHRAAFLAALKRESVA